MTKSEKAQIMYERFGKTPGCICRDCCHMVGRSSNRKYNKCEVYGSSSSEATDFGIFQQACGMYNKETDIRDIYKENIRRKPKGEIQPETLFDGGNE